MSKKKLFWQKFFACSVVFLSFLITTIGISITNNVLATVSDTKLRMFAQNDIQFYDDCSGESDTKASKLNGDNNAEKIWNYFVDMNLSGFSDSAEAIAGVIGNFAVESSSEFNPFAVNDGGCTGISQECGKSEQIKNAVLSAGCDWGGTSTENIDCAIRAELDFITSTPDWAQFINGLTRPTHQTGTDGAKSYAELFLGTYERAVGGSGGTLDDDGVKNYLDELGYSDYSHGQYQATGKRREQALAIYNQYKSSMRGSNDGSSEFVKYTSLDQAFTWYGQADSRWANSPFGGTTIGSDGCGPTSFAMMLTAMTGKEHLPDEVAKQAGDGGMAVSCDSESGLCSSWRITEYLAEIYNIEYEDISSSEYNADGGDQKLIDAINKKLDEGWMIHTSGDGSAPFTAGGHYIGIRGKTTDGKWLIADSASETNTLSKEWEPADVIRGMNPSVRAGNVKAIRGTGGANGLNPCGGGSSNDGSLVSGGMNLEQATEFMKIYKDAASTNESGNSFGATWHISVGCHDNLLLNCVSFSQYFINRYTSLDTWTHTTDGVGVVNKLSSLYGLITSTTPKVYAVFSYPGPSSAGHTGVVLGIDTDNNKIIIGEAGCLSSSSWQAAYDFIGAKEESLSAYTGNGYTYAYLDDKIIIDGK